MANRWRRVCWHFWRKRKSVVSRSRGKKILACAHCRRRWLQEARQDRGSDTGSHHGVDHSKDPSGDHSGNLSARSFIAGTAVVLSFFTGTAFLGGMLAQQTVLDGGRAGQVADQALGDPALAPTVLARLVPGYADLDAADRTVVRRVASDEATRAAAREVTFDEDTGDIDLSPIRTQLVAGLQDDQQPLAKRVAHDSRDIVVTVPAEDLARYRDASQIASTVTDLSGLVTIGLVALALLLSTNRLQTCRSIGITALIATCVVGAAYWLLAQLTATTNLTESERFATLLVEACRATVLTILVPIAVGALLMIVVPTFAGRLRDKSAVEHQPATSEPSDVA